MLVSGSVRYQGHTSSLLLVLCCKEAPLNTPKWIEIVISLTVGVPQMAWRSRRWPCEFVDGQLNVLHEMMRFVEDVYMLCAQECVAFPVALDHQKSQSKKITNARHHEVTYP